MLERAMWIASGSRSGLVLMMMEPDAPKGYTVLDTMHTATRISIDVPTFLGGSSPGKRHTQNRHKDTQAHGHTNRCIAWKMGKSTLMPVAACCQMHQHRFPSFSGRRIAQKRKEIYADACRRMQPQASTYISYSSGRCIAQTSRQIYANAFGCMQPQASVWMSLLFWAMHRPEKVGTSMPMLVVARMVSNAV